MSDGPAIIQGDRSVLLEVDHPRYEEGRDVLARYAELEKSPEHVHTYRLSELSLWNAAEAGVDAETVLSSLRAISRFPIPSHVEHEIRDLLSRHGVCSLHAVASDPHRLRLSVRDPSLRQRFAADRKVGPLVSPCPDGFLLPTAHRGAIKQALLRIGFPVTDRAGMVDGDPLAFELRRDVFTPYAYQREGARAFLASGGHGVVVLPCGAGKTVLSMIAMQQLGARTLVLTTNVEAARQWRRELLDKTSLGERDVAVYSSKDKAVGPVTISTYAMLGRRGGDGPTRHVHFDRLTREGWGLVVYDEVHLLPAPVFRLTAELQARRRLGLTATLVREDGRAGDVFALIGPKRYDVPWRELEASGHIAAATCLELRVPLPAALEVPYAIASAREQPRIAADNPLKLRALRELLDRHGGDRVLVLGTYLGALRSAAKIAGAPLVSGEMSAPEREKHYEAFRRGQTRRLVLSKVGNFAIDLPDANVLVQISGSMGSRQEEAQRLGRILRPKPGGATFYSIVTRHTVEQQHALHRQMFLTEQGYRYFIEDWTGDGGEEGARVLH